MKKVLSWKLLSLMLPDTICNMDKFLEDLNEEIEWLKMISKDPAFDFLKDTEEDIYSFNGGILIE